LKVVRRSPALAAEPEEALLAAPARLPEVLALTSAATDASVANDAP
jgi:hypothetical protein